MRQFFSSWTVTETHMYDPPWTHLISNKNLHKWRIFSFGRFGRRKIKYGWTYTLIGYFVVDHQDTHMLGSHQNYPTDLIVDWI